MKWVTRERDKVDRVACPWLIRKFVDPEAEFLFVPADQGLAVVAADDSHREQDRRPATRFASPNEFSSIKIVEQIHAIA